MTRTNLGQIRVTKTRNNVPDSGRSRLRTTRGDFDVTNWWFAARFALNYQVSRIGKSDSQREALPILLQIPQISTVAVRHAGAIRCRPGLGIIMRNSAGKSSKKDRNRLLAARVPNNRLLGEQMMADIHHVIEENEFASIEEANAFPATLTGTGLRQALRHAAPPSSREQAQQLAFEAMDARTEKQARKLAQQTLALDPDCVDAIAFLADLNSRSLEEPITGLQNAVQAGERALGPKFFRGEQDILLGIAGNSPVHGRPHGAGAIAVRSRPRRGRHSSFRGPAGAQTQRQPGCARYSARPLSLV